MSRRAPLWIAIGLVLSAVVTFWPVLDQPFLAYDDNVYVVDNPAVNQGLSLAGLRAASLGFHAANWHPVTWLSHQLDVTLFGLGPAGHHATNLALHALNALLLFLWLDRAFGPGRRRRAAFVAAVFAVHPLAVDSVAWVAERKNLLATAFGFAAVLAWIGHTRAPSALRYAGVAALFALGLMSKPMLVTLPALLLLLDVWPLDRLASAGLRRLILEKLPLLALSLGAAGLTVLAQSAGGAVEDLAPFPAWLRIGNALVALPTYLGLVIWPTWPNAMAILHPHPGAALVLWQVAASTAAIGLGAFGLVRVRHTRPYLWIGAAWMALALLPVIGLVQVGAQSHAERYAYLPMVGALVAVTWWAADLARERSLPRNLVGPAAVIVLLLLAMATRSELRHWRDETTLFSRAVEVYEHGGVRTRHAMILYYQLGHALQVEGQNEAAVERYRLALEHNGDDPRPHNNLGSSLAALGRDDEAAAHYERALEVDPRHPSALFNLALYEQRRGSPERARALYMRFLKRGVHAPATRNAAIRALIELGAPLAAASAALQVTPGDAESLALAGEALRQAGQEAHALMLLERAIALDPSARALRNNLAHLLATSTDPAVRDPARALAIMQGLAAGGPLDAAEQDTLKAAGAASNSD